MPGRGDLSPPRRIGRRTSLMIRIKICGLTTVADVRFVEEADAIGLNFYHGSPRGITVDLARSIVRAIPPFMTPVGVFVNELESQCVTIAAETGLRAIQTYELDSVSPNRTVSWIPSLRIRDERDIQTARDLVQIRQPDAILVDSHVPGQMGGSGIPAPWHLLAGVRFGVPLILAGGLTPDNVAEAIRIVRPWGVDVASGVESSPGVKDPGKVRAFIAAARAASVN